MFWSTPLMFGLSIVDILICLVQGITCTLLGSVVFDTIHYALHRLARSKYVWLQRIGNLHERHHEFLDRQLVHHPELWQVNLRHHLIPELVTQLLVVSLFFVWFRPLAVAATLAVLVCVFVFVAFVLKGHDPNHQAVPRLRGLVRGVLVFPEYHLHHHVYPLQFMGSYLTLFDVVAGTACPLTERRFAVTGASGAYGKALVQQLRKLGVDVVVLPFAGPTRAAAPSSGEVNWTYDDYARVERVLEHVDVLVLAHGSKRELAMQANCDSFVTLIELFKRVSAHRQVPPEIWATGSEIECHPHFGNEELKIYKASKMAYKVHAKRFYKDPSMTYRHIVCSAFTSRMGKGLLSGGAVVAISLFLIRRGFRYIPVTYTGIAFVNFFTFIFSRTAARADAGVPTRTA